MAESMQMDDLVSCLTRSFGERSMCNVAFSSLFIFLGLSFKYPNICNVEMNKKKEEMNE